MFSDADLVRRAQSGDMDALGEVFDRHWQHVWRAAFSVVQRRALADEVAQDAFIRAASAIQRLDPSRPIRPWLVRIAVNHAIDRARHESRAVAVAELPEIAVEHDSEAQYDLMDALASLPVERRLVVVLRFVLGYSLAEIAQVLGTAEGTVASRLSRGLDELRTKLRERNHV